MTSAIDKNKDVFEKLILTGTITLDEVIENIWKVSTGNNLPINPYFKEEMTNMFLLSQLPIKICKDVKYNTETKIFTLIRAKIN